jgi:hypothetical protein
MSFPNQMANAALNRGKRENSLTVKNEDGRDDVNYRS